MAHGNDTEQNREECIIVCQSEHIQRRKANEDVRQAFSLSEIVRFIRRTRNGKCSSLDRVILPADGSDTEKERGKC